MSRKAALGFQYSSLDEEMRMPSQRDLDRSLDKVAGDSHKLETASKLRWWHRNKRLYNLRRRTVACSIEKRYKVAKARAIRRGWGWEFDPEEWERAWMEAPWVLVPGSVNSRNPEGIVVPAFALRGSHVHKNTCMQRLDIDKSWSLKNYKIMFRGEELRPGNRWYREAPREQQDQQDIS